ncbi:membrane peptidoglycan carboxypeptidase [Allocatelliglobosispora scoriae]|uniref:Membrane peptidoglycan carboxypeptidase n=1 Tax=Allocatelliglobosispora scoriae TaxID=643052 RepID=A0A841BQX2_9ACTN|nr:transglycosylase domain-containing protein [Allocatelliglobosispora scoriae]MBB5869589.1 membrane peptidoglycan carboxypeptidase [Allocatelliglobosispora scoriae]
MTAPSRRKALSKLALAVLIASGLIAGVAIPVTAAAAWALDHAGVAYDELPSELRNPTSVQASYLYANDGKTLITTFYDQNRRDVKLADVAEPMRKAIVAAEDARFYEHGGVDVKSIFRAAVANGTSGDVEQGASTLTMQLVRNVLKNDPNLTAEEQAEAVEQTPGRKLREARYAITLDQTLSKDEILERYLNIAYFGAGAYGVYAASHTYFAKDPSKLTVAESALLAGLLQSPEADSPISGDETKALGRRTYVLHAMSAMGAISETTAKAADAEKLVLTQGATPNDCTAVPSAHNDWGFFCDYFRDWWSAQAAFGETVADRQTALRTGGYRIVTSLDPTVQAAAQKQALTVYGYSNKRAAPMAVVQPGTGRVLAMAVNRKYSVAPNPKGQKNYPNTVNKLIAGGGGIHGYQAGSTFKMFTMLAALESGQTLDTGFNAPGKLVTEYPDGGENACDGYWCPGNANPSWMNGYRTMWTGFGRSVNTYFVWLEQQIGAERAVAMAEKLGIKFRDEESADLAANSPGSWGAFTLGVALTTPLDLANAYATIASEGTYCSPLPVESITDPAGKALDVANPACHRAISADVARAATDAARCPVGQQSAFNRCSGGTATQVDSLLGGRDVAGKTGSTDGNTTETFVGFTPQLAAAMIAANPDDTRDAVGGPIQQDVIEAVARTLAASLKGQQKAEFTAPSLKLAFESGHNWTRPKKRDGDEAPNRTPTPGTTSPSPPSVP